MKIETKEVSLRIKDLRQKLKMTQEEVAEKSNLSVDQFGLIERNQTGFTLKSIYNISKALQTDLNYLLLGLIDDEDNAIHQFIKSVNPIDRYSLEKIATEYLKMNSK